MAEHEGGAPQPAEIQEKAKTPEMERIPSTRVGLSARLFLGPEALNPKKNDLKDLQETQINDANLSESINRVKALSKSERTSYWEGKEDNNFEKQKIAWAEQVQATLLKKASTGTDDEKKEWTEFYKKVGIDGDITTDKLLTLYNEFFTGNTYESNLVTFVGKVAGGYMKNNAPDVVSLQQDMEKIAWFSNIFGENTSKVMPYLFDAALATSGVPQCKEQLLQKTNTKQNGISRLNRLTDEEKRLLGLLYSEESKETVPPTPREPEKKPEETKGKAPGGKDETEPLIKQPTIVIPKEQLDALKQKKVKVGEQEVTYADLLGQIVDLNTGNIKDNLPPLHAEYTALKTELKNLLSSLDDATKEKLSKGTQIALSPLAWNMIDAIAKKANDTNKMLSFNLLLDRLEKDSDEKSIAFAAAPAVDFTKAAEKHVVLDPDVQFRSNEINKLAGQAGIEKVQAIPIHIHQAHLGEKFTGTPTDEDIAEAVHIVTNSKRSRYQWGVATRTSDGSLHLELFETVKKREGGIKHYPTAVFSPDNKNILTFPGMNVRNHQRSQQKVI